MNAGEKTFIDFLRLGKLKDLALEMSVQQVVMYLGPPDEYLTREAFFNDWPKIKKSWGTEEHIFLDYAQLELTFRKSDERLVLLQFEPKLPVNTRLPAVLDDGFLDFISGMNRQEFKALISKMNIVCYEAKISPDTVLDLRVLGSCVEVTFDLEDGADELYAISKSIWMLDCHPSKETW